MTASHSARLGPVPDRVLAGPDRRPVGEVDPHVLESEVAVDALQQFAEVLGLGRDLVLGAEDVGVVLRERAHPHQAVQGARGLVAVAGAELGHPQGQVAVAVQALVEDLHVAGAVHRLQRQRLVLGLEREHVLAELLPVAGHFPQAAIEQLRAPDLDVARRLEPAPEIGLDHAIDGPALGMPEDRARRLLLEVEQIELLAEPAMIAPLRFLEPVQVGVELLAARERGAVDPLEHGVAAVAPPVGAGQLGQLEGADPAGRGPMRAAAQVEPVALVVERDRLAFRNVIEQVQLVALAQRLEAPAGGRPAHDLALERLVGGDDLRHPRLDPLEVLGRERLVAGEVVVEAVLDRRPDRDLGAGVQVLDRLGHDVGAVVADDRQRRLVLVADEAHVSAVRQLAREVPELAVDLPDAYHHDRGRLGEPGTDRRR